MRTTRKSILICTVSLVAVLLLALAAGCTGTDTKSTAPADVTPAGTQPAQAGPAMQTTAAVSTAAAPAATPAVPVSTGQKQTIKISGSTTVLPIVQKAADQYMATHPGADIQISGGGSGVGIQAIGAKTVDIGMSSREVTSAEKAKYPSFVITTVAQDGIAVVEPGQ